MSEELNLNDLELQMKCNELEELGMKLNKSFVICIGGLTADETGMNTHAYCACATKGVLDACTMMLSLQQTMIDRYGYENVAAATILLTNNMGEAEISPLPTAVEDQKESGQ